MRVHFQADQPSHCDNCGWKGVHGDLIQGKYCPNHAKTGHPVTARPAEGEA